MTGRRRRERVTPRMIRDESRRARTSSDGARAALCVGVSVGVGVRERRRGRGREGEGEAGSQSPVETRRLKKTSGDAHKGCPRYQPGVADGRSCPNGTHLARRGGWDGEMVGILGNSSAPAAPVCASCRPENFGAAASRARKSMAGREQRARR